MVTPTQGASGPNPFCEIGRTHPRDRHRMRPVDEEPNVWFCPRHELFARVIEPALAGTLDRGDPYELRDGRTATVLRIGDERGGGVLLYYRFETD